MEMKQIIPCSSRIIWAILLWSLKNNWIFPRSIVYERTTSRRENDTIAGMRIMSGRRDERMIGKKRLGLAAVFLLLLVIATPGFAKEKTIQLNIPGCST